MALFSFLLQRNAMDCGPTCLHMVSKAYSRSFSLEKLRELTEIGKEGVNILGISDAAEKIGYRTQALQLSITELKEAKLQGIIKTSFLSIPGVWSCYRQVRFYFKHPNRQRLSC